MEPLELCYRSLNETGDKSIAEGRLLDVLRQVSCFGLSLVKLDIRQESDRHSDVMDAITQYLDLGSYKEWSEEEKQTWLLSELQGKRPLFGHDLPVTEEIKEVLDTFRVISELPYDSFGPYIISMATAPSDVLAVELLQRECHIKQPLRVVPLFEKLTDLENAQASLMRLFSINWYRNKINGRQEVMLGYSDSGKDAGRLSAAWQVFKTQEDCVKVAQQFGIKLSPFMVVEAQLEEAEALLTLPYCHSLQIPFMGLYGSPSKEKLSKNLSERNIYVSAPYNVLLSQP